MYIGIWVKIKTMQINSTTLQQRGLVVERLTAVATVAGSNPTSDTCPVADPAAV